LSGWLIVADRLADLPEAVREHPAVRTREYIMSPPASRRPAPKILNLARSYAYQSLGYYCSPPGGGTRAQGGAGGHHHPRPFPPDDLRARALRPRRNAGPNHQALGRPPFRLLVCLDQADDPRFARFARQLFDQFRCPIIEVFVRAGETWRIRKLAPVGIDELGKEGKDQLAAAIQSFVRRPWKTPRARAEPRFTLGVLHDPKEQLPPSDVASLRHFARIAEGHGLGVELITKKDYDRIPEFEALWIRETTNIDHHTFRFAKRAEQEGLPVIDDPASIIRCTNKVYLAELLQGQGVPTPRTVIISSPRELEALEGQLGYPMVLKIPDGSFSRGVTRGGQPGRARADGARHARGLRPPSWLRNTCTPPMTGGWACWTASRSSSRST
jgi:hypothetical protein